MIFLTGGTGLVGAHILLKLTESGQKVKALKRKRSSLTVIKNIFSHYKKTDLLKSIEWIEGDLLDLFSLQEGIKGCNTVIHCAAIVSFNPKDFKKVMKINVEGTANIVNICLENNIEKLAYISSIATLNDEKNQVRTEDSFWKESKSNSQYAKSKYLSEQEVWRGIEEGLNSIIVNPSVILGPGDWTKGSSQMFEKVWKGLKFYSSGSTGYIDVLDVAKCVVKLLEKEIINERFILNAENIKYRDIFDSIAENLNKPKPHIKVSPLIKEIAWRIEWLKSFITNKSPLITKETANTAMKNKSFSNEKIIKALDYKFIPIEESIKHYSQWFLEEYANC
ncbi:NAD-dependent epimerase/dehydratase family protein [Flavobacteriales bacterium]|nr:NAD-dependent epimerase/dehydratase family protein [Flavobacteriales bacterium]